LLGPLRRDAQIPEEILLQVKQVFLALPSRIQARILLTAIQHPAARASWADDTNGESGESSNDTDDVREGTAEIVRDLLSAGGVVAVKLAQVIAEDPRVRSLRRTLDGLDLVCPGPAYQFQNALLAYDVGAGAI
jgi:hypothetical protein